MLDERDTTRAEGAELRLHSVGPLPPEALDELHALFCVARANRERMKLLGGQPIEAVKNPVVASALVLADQDLDAADAHFAAVAARMQAAPPLPPDMTARAVAAAEERLREVAAAAAAEGVRFEVKVAVPKPVA